MRGNSYRFRVAYGDAIEIAALEDDEESRIW